MNRGLSHDQNCKLHGNLIACCIIVCCVWKWTKVCHIVMPLIYSYIYSLFILFIYYINNILKYMKSREWSV